MCRYRGWFSNIFYKISCFFCTNGLTVSKAFIVSIKIQYRTVIGEKWWILRGLFELKYFSSFIETKLEEKSILWIQWNHLINILRRQDNWGAVLLLNYVGNFIGVHVQRYFLCKGMTKYLWIRDVTFDSFLFIYDSLEMLKGPWGEREFWNRRAWNRGIPTLSKWH